MPRQKKARKEKGRKSIIMIFLHARVPRPGEKF